MSSTLCVEEVHDVLSIMEKNLECPICLDLMKEPVTTKCDHIFCRFCMLKLLNKKKKGFAQCPMCKHEVTKRSLQESPRFRLLVEGLLTTIRAFELDTGLKFACSPDNSTKAIETYSSEQLVKDVGVLIQSTGYRNRRKRTLSYGQDNPVNALKAESNVNLKKDLIEASPRRSKRPKRTSGKRVHVKFGSVSSEDILEKAGSIGKEEKDSVQTPHHQSKSELEKCEERDSDTVDERSSLRPDAEEIIPSDLAEYDFSERENESSKGVASRVDDFKTTTSSLSEKPVPNKFGIAAPTSSMKESNRFSLHNGEEYSSRDVGTAWAEEMPITKKEKISKRRLSSRNKVGDEKESRTFKPDFDCSYEKESSPALDADLPDSCTSCSGSRKRARISVRRVSEWLSKLDDEMFAAPLPDDCTLNLEAEPLLCEEDKGERDVDSLASDKTEIMLSPLEAVPQHEHCQPSSKPTVATIEQQIFGKTYKRERKSNPQLNLSSLNDSKSADDITMGPAKEYKNVTCRTLRRRKKTADLQPEDFILKLDKTDHVIDRVPKGKADTSTAVHFDVVSVEDIMDEADGAEGQPRVSDAHRFVIGRIAENKVTPSAVDFEICPPKVPLKGSEVLNRIVTENSKPVCKTLHEQVEGNNKSTEPPFNAQNQMLEADHFPIQVKRGKTPTRRTPALELVSKSDLLKDQYAKKSEAVSLPSPRNQIDLQIDSFPSSEEPNKVTNSPKSFRRSRRLQLFNEETSFLIKPGINLATGGKKEATGGKEDMAPKSAHLVEGEKSDPNANCSLSEKHKNCGEHTSENKCTENTLHHIPDSEQSSKKDFNPLLSEETIEWSPVGLHNESEEEYTQNSASLLSSHKTDQTTSALPNVNVNPTTLNSDASSDSSCVDLNSCNRNQCVKSQLPQLAVVTTKSMEVEDSELETEYLLKSFKGAKRRSFILQSSPPKNIAAECCVPQTTRDEVSNDKDATNGKAQHDSIAQNGQATAKGCSYDCNELQTDACGSLRDHVCSSTDCNNPREKDLINVESEVICPTITEANMASSDKGPLKCCIGNGCSLSPMDVVESSFRNIFKGNSMSMDSPNAGDIIVQGTDSHTINETELSDGPDRTGKGTVLVSNYKHDSVRLPLAVSHPVPTADCFEVTTGTTDSGVNEPVENCYHSSALDNEQGNPLYYVGRAQESIMINDQKQPGAAPCSAPTNTPGLSATPDGLLGSCSAHNSNDNSGLLTKMLENDKLPERNIEGNSSGSSIVRYKRLSDRHSALKLFSSESSAEEDLPCFQALLFGDAFNPSLDSAGPNNSTNECSTQQQGGGLLRSSSSALEQEQEAVLDLPGEECPSPSPSHASECSVNLFSSQSNISETSAIGVEETKQPLIVVSNQRRCLPETKEPALMDVETALGLHQEGGADAGFDCDNGKGTAQPLGECSEYESEASHTGDSSGLSSQSEILTTQQRNAMQNNLEKLQKEMAALQAVLEQNETQDLETENATAAPQHRDTADSSNGRGRSPERGTLCTSKLDTEMSKNGVCNNSTENEHDVIPGYAPGSEREELEYLRSPTPPSTPSLSQLSKRKTPERVRVSMRLLKELKETASAEGEVMGTVVTHPIMPDEENEQMEAGISALSNNYSSRSGVDEKSTGPRRSSARVLSRLCENIGITPNKPCPSVRSSVRRSFDHAKDSLVSPCITSKDHPRNPKRGEQKTLASTFVSPARNSAVSVTVKTPIVTAKRKISMVASGLNQSELLLVQKFSSKTQSTLSHQITDGTTHVIMKTDADLVCERTLKYFLGIAGRKWVISSQWIVHCFKEGRILDEVDFEVKGDVINGRNHGGPRRARLAPDGVLWKDFEICCYGSFTDMTTEHLEWMVKLCGGSVVKQLDEFTHKSSTAVVVVQPDACPEETDFGAIKRAHNVTVVTREWMLDSVACYKCKRFDDYLLVES